MRKFLVSCLSFRVCFVICILFTISACKKKEKIPSYILPQEKMKVVVWDLMRVDQFLGDFVFPYDTALNKDSQSIRYYQQVLAIHNLSKEEFNRSWTYYNEHPGFMQAIMDSIGKINTATLPVTANPTPDTVKTPPPVKKRFLTPDSIIRQRGKKVLEVQ